MTDWRRFDGRTEWWFNTKTGQVEEGPQSLGTDRLGPFETREDAARALEIIAERSRAWADEDAAEEDY
ncbi:MAG: methionine aminopeptidase [Cryobacterium sp.]|nr:methionine aminopeptidase [Cryobacterium sp.]